MACVQKIRPFLLCLNESRLLQNPVVFLHVFFVLYTCHTHAAQSRHTRRCPLLPTLTTHRRRLPSNHPSSSLSHVSSAAARMPQPIPHGSGSGAAARAKVPQCAATRQSAIWAQHSSCCEALGPPHAISVLKQRLTSVIFSTPQ